MTSNSPKGAPSSKTGKRPKPKRELVYAGGPAGYFVLSAKQGDHPFKSPANSNYGSCRGADSQSNADRIVHVKCQLQMTPDSDLQLSLEECPRIVELIIIGNLDKGSMPVEYH